MSEPGGVGRRRSQSLTLPNPVRVGKRQGDYGCPGLIFAYPYQRIINIRLFMITG
jgi:hypothetical protein